MCKKLLISRNYIFVFFCSEFEVDSVNFPGQVHRWRLSQLLQKGSERRRDALLGDMALALRFIIVTARARIVAPHFFSVRQALKSLLAGTLRLIGEKHSLFYPSFLIILNVYHIIYLINLQYDMYLHEILCSCVWCLTYKNNFTYVNRIDSFTQMIHILQKFNISK